MAGSAAPSTTTALGALGSRGPSRQMPKQTGLQTQTPRQPFVKRLDKLKQNQSDVQYEWREITDFIRPRRGIYLGDPNKARQRRSTKIINPEANVASRTLGSGMMSGVSSPARPWFNLDLPSEQIKELGDVKTWLYSGTHTVQDVLAKSNFYQAVQQFYRDLGDFGNACMICDEHYQNVVNYTVFAPGQYYWATGDDGRVNTLYAEFTKTVIQLVEAYGLENCSDRVREMYNRGSVDEVIKCVMAIEPNMRQIQGLPGPQGWPWIVVYFELEGMGGTDKDRLLRRSGYREWPVAAARWDVQSGEDYGSGPGLDALGDAKSLQQLELRKAQAVDKIVKPPRQAPVSPGTQVSDLPGGLTYLPTTSATAAVIKPIYEIPAQAITAISQEIDRVERRINRTYYADLFLMMAQSDRREITAREVEERHEEKLLALGPVLERLHNEALNVMIERTFMICFRAGLIPPPPERIQGMPLGVQYTSILAQAQRAVAVGAIERFFGFIGSLSSAYPTVIDKADVDQAVDEYGSALGVPPSVIRSDDAVVEMRKERVAAQQQDQQMQQGTIAAQNAKVLSETQVGSQSALDTLLGMSGPAQ